MMNFNRGKTGLFALGLIAAALEGGAPDILEPAEKGSFNYISTISRKERKKRTKKRKAAHSNNMRMKKRK